MSSNIGRKSIKRETRDENGGFISAEENGIGSVAEVFKICGVDDVRKLFDFIF